MPDYKLRKKMAQDGFLFDGSKFVFNDNPEAVKEYLDSSFWKLPNLAKRVQVKKSRIISNRSL